MKNFSKELKFSRVINSKIFSKTLQKPNILTKMNYSEVFLKEYQEIKKVDRKPKILLHVCCGACSIYPLIFLTYLFDITILFSNSNIYPKEEFDHRLSAVKEHIEFVEKTFNEKINLIVDSYEYDDFRNSLLPLSQEKEGGARCKVCISKRMNRLFRYAHDFGFKYVGTIMSVSRNKDVNYLSKAGERLEKEYPNIKFVHFDFKKNNGQDLGVEIGKLEKIYRQNYCGCEFSENFNVK